MTIYNKPLLFIGFAIGVTGGLLDYYQHIESTMTVILQFVGVIVMLFAFKKPRHQKDNPD